MTTSIFALYVLYQRPDTMPVWPSPLPVISAPPTTSAPSLAPRRPVRTPPPTPPPASIPVPVASGRYRDGQYVGTSADAYYGRVQVQVAIQGGKIADVQFLDHPSDRRTSQMINNQAMPYLRAEAIQAQSAQVDIVSGATDTSQAFQQSLAAALTQAVN